jgi:FtsH-binding integral membrane protein
MQPITITGAAVLLINGLCILLAAIIPTGYYWYPAMFGIASTGLIVFFGVIIQNLRSGTEKEISSESMRLATAGLITSTYIALVAYCVFLAETFKLAAFSETLVTNFTAVVGTVLAFFFGSSAYIEARTKTEKKGSSEKKAE